jgi:iron complex outermembrane receptor protein
VSYDFTGLDQGNNPLDQTAKLNFFNPKVGFNYMVNKQSSLYAFGGIGNKEPSRDDYTESTPTNRPKHENLLDIELGYRHYSENLNLTVNLYNMQYKNQLILTGELNDVGSAVRVNIPDSYRRGIEFTGAVKLMDKLTWSFNTTLSQNKIASFNKFVDNWDTYGLDEENYSNTDIAFSPSIIAGSQLIFSAINSTEIGKLDFAFISKYVGDQFIDNTSSEFAKLDEYFVHDFRINYLIKNIEISAWIRNLLNQNYISNAWVYRFNTSTSDPTTYDAYANSAGGVNQYNQIGAFNQAGINFFVGLKLRF